MRAKITVRSVCNAIVYKVILRWGRIYCMAIYVRIRFHLLAYDKTNDTIFFQRILRNIQNALLYVIRQSVRLNRRVLLKCTV